MDSPKQELQSHGDLISHILATRDRGLDLSKLDTGGLPEHFKPSNTFREILGSLETARRRKRKLALVTGSHGVGKTTALYFYASKRGALIWECTPSYKPKHVLADIAQKLGINAGTGWRMQTSIVVEQLRAGPRTIILDEAQRLDYAGFDLLKYIADQAAGTLFVFGSSPSLETRINRWPDIASRCTVRIHARPMSLEELVELYQPEGFGLEALEEMHRLTGGIMRVLRDLIEQLDMDISHYNQTHEDRVGRESVKSINVREGAERVIG